MVRALRMSAGMGNCPLLVTLAVDIFLTSWKSLTGIYHLTTWRRSGHHRLLAGPALAVHRKRQQPVAAPGGGASRRRRRYDGRHERARIAHYADHPSPRGGRAAAALGGAER